MKWGELQIGDVVTYCNYPYETCLLLEKADDGYTWFVLMGNSYLSFGGSNPYKLHGTKVNENIADSGWEVYLGKR